MAVPYPFTIKRNNQSLICICSLNLLGTQGKPASFVLFEDRKCVLGWLQSKSIAAVIVVVVVMADGVAVGAVVIVVADATAPARHLVTAMCVLRFNVHVDMPLEMVLGVRRLPWRRVRLGHAIAHAADVDLDGVTRLLDRVQIRGDGHRLARGGRSPTG